MALYTQTIGKDFPHGFAGSYAQQPDMIIATFPAGGSANIPFGTPVKLSSGSVVPMGAGDTAAAFLGIASKEIKSAFDYTNQGVGAYAPGEATSVFQRGSINVICQRGTPSYGGAVYLRITANASYPSAVVGGLEASADGDNTIQIPNCAWQGGADANGVAELRILSLMQPGTGGGSAYELPVASASTLGGVKQGSNTTVAEGGAITTNTATATVAGAVLQAAAVADAAGDNPTAAEYNALLTALRTAGIITTT